MARAGLIMTFVVGVAIGVIFALYPKLDLLAAAHFSAQGAGAVVEAFVYSLRDSNMKVSVAFAGLALGALLFRLMFRNAPMLVPARAIMLILLTYVIGPGLVANVVLKDHWSRPRPIQVIELGGSQSFKPWWDPRGSCPKNCSFISGEASAAFATLSVAAVIPGAMGYVAIAAALLYGLVVGAIRVMVGAHFVSDILMAGVAITFVVWALHGLIYRWPATRITEQQAEDAIDRFGRLFRADALPDATHKQIAGQTSGFASNDVGDTAPKR